MIRALPLFVGFAPVLGVTAAYWINVEAGILPLCMPFLDGCISISATGRYEPGSLVFRAVMLPQATFLAVLWWLSAGWIMAFPSAKQVRRSILIFGVVGAVSLIVYVTFLGTTQPFYEFMRRFGIYGYFLGTVLAQMILSWSMPSSGLRRTMLIVIVAPFILGAINLIQKSILSHPNNIENSIEWIAAALMQVWFVLLYFGWRNSGITVTVETDPEN